MTSRCNDGGQLIGARITVWLGRGEQNILATVIGDRVEGEDEEGRIGESHTLELENASAGNRGEGRPAPKEMIEERGHRSHSKW